MSAPFVILRDTISGVATEYTPKRAKALLEHPVWSKRLIVVDTAKPEVLAPEYTIEDGERKPIKSEKTKTPVNPEKDSE